MHSPQDIITRIKQQKMLPLFYNADAEVCIGVVNALYAAGIRLIEFTNRGEKALANFTALVNARNKHMNDLLLGAGTIKNAAEADSFINAGADFLVSPFFDNEVCKAAAAKQILWIPGCMTPTEIHTAENAGCSLIKLFPGNVLGPGFVSAIKELFPNIDFMPTGGVEQDNLQAWFSAGVCAVGMGSKLVSRQLMDSKDYVGLENNTRNTLQLLKTITH